MNRSSRPRKSASSLSASTNHQLNMYVLAASAAGVGMLALSQQAEAKIVYTQIHRVIGSDEHYDLDLNHDGVVDFDLINSYSYSSHVFVEPRGSRSNAVAGIPYYYYAYALRAGAEIGPALPLKGSLMAGYDSKGVSDWFGYWVNVKNRYLGLKFKIKGKFHFGWARLSVKLVRYQGLTATLTGYAYETVPNKAIKAGQTEGPDDGSIDGPDADLSTPTPKPATLGLLAVGSPALSIWRREESVGVAR